MTVFRWIVGVLAGLFALGSAFGFGLYVAFDSDLWLQRARSFRHAVWLLLLLWFNAEVWGRVVWTLVHWARP